MKRPILVAYIYGFSVLRLQSCVAFSCAKFVQLEVHTTMNTGCTVRRRNIRLDALIRRPAIKKGGLSYQGISHGYSTNACLRTRRQKAEIGQLAKGQESVFACYSSTVYLTFACEYIDFFLARELTESLNKNACVSMCCMMKHRLIIDCLKI